MPVLAVIAGPNGSGKTTFSNLWRHCLSYPLHNFPVSDPDAVMVVLTPNDPVAAGRLTPTDRQHMLKSGRSFAVETTLAGASTLKLMRQARERGYSVLLFYIALATPKLNLLRIRMRVAQGGHDVPQADVLRRARRSKANFMPALALSDRAWVVDNSGHQFALGARSDGKSVKVLEGAPAWIRDLLRSIPNNAMRQA